MSAPRPDLQAHYGCEGLLEQFEALLRRCADAGADADVDVDAALARGDEFHPGGRAATDELARLAAVAPGERVLDLGCGIGGPARRLRRLVGPQGAVTGVDVVAEYCRTARGLCRRAADTADVAIVHADVLALDLPGARFDVAWSQHAQMNVADKAGWVAAVRRHLRAGGRYACFESFAGPGGTPLYPVPWAADEAASWLATPGAWRARLEDAGFVTLHWQDHSAATVVWLDASVAAQKALGAAGDPAAALNVGLLLGPQASLMSRNLRRNLEEGRLQAFMGVFGLPPA